jgi:transcriptional regulator with XRE-family HTH domain
MSSTSEVVFRQAIGAALRELRQETHLTLDDVWAATGIGPSQLVGIERGSRALHFAEAIYLAHVFETTLNEITARAEAIVEDWVNGGSRIGHATEVPRANRAGALGGEERAKPHGRHPRQAR